MFSYHTGTGRYDGVLGATGWLFPPPQSSLMKKGFLRSPSSSGGIDSMPGAGSEVIDYRDPTLHGGLYMPDDRYNISVTKLTEVDVLCSQWFLKTTHLKLLFREEVPTWATGEDMALSYALRKFAGLPSYVMPIALSNEDTWGNAAPEAHTTGNVEASIQGTGSGMVAARNEVSLGGRLCARVEATRGVGRERWLGGHGLSVKLYSFAFEKTS